MLFVNKYYSENDNVLGSVVVHRVRSAFLDLLKSVDWLSNATWHIALEKGDRLLLYIGAPQEYSFLRYPNTDNSFNTSMWASTAAVVHRLSTLDQPVDRSPSHWTFPADTVKAWYDDAMHAAFVPDGAILPSAV